MVQSDENSFAPKPFATRQSSVNSNSQVDFEVNLDSTNNAEPNFNIAENRLLPNNQSRIIQINKGILDPKDVKFLSNSIRYSTVVYD